MSNKKQSESGESAHHQLENLMDALCEGLSSGDDDEINTPQDLKASQDFRKKLVFRAQYEEHEHKRHYPEQYSIEELEMHYSSQQPSPFQEPNDFPNDFPTKKKN